MSDAGRSFGMIALAVALSLDQRAYPLLHMDDDCEDNLRPLEPSKHDPEKVRRAEAKRQRRMARNLRNMGARDE